MLKIEYKDHIGYENKRLENEIHSRMAAYRASVGGEELTMMQCWIIRFLYEHERTEVYQRDIEAEFSIARSTATGILKLMEKKGYIRRVSVERDARLKKIELTESGLKFHDNVERSIDDMEERLASGLTEKQKQDFFTIIAQIRGQLEREIALDGEKLGKDRDR